MNCTNHPDKPAFASCEACQKPFCADCLYEIGGKYYCDEHGPYGRILLHKSGQAENAPEPPVKCRSIYVGLALLLGPTGAHFFYSGKTGSGIAMFVISGVLLAFGAFGGIGPLPLILMWCVSVFQAGVITTDGYDRPMV